MEHSKHSLHKARIIQNVLIDGGEKLKSNGLTTPRYLASCSSFQGMSLYKCTVIASILKDCMLSNCTLLSCTILDSKLDNCTIRQDVQPSLYLEPFYLHNSFGAQGLLPPTHIRKPSILRNCETKSCAVTNSTISRGSAVHGGRLASCEVQYSTIGKAVVSESSILECKVDNCNLYFSKYQGCKMSRTSKMRCKGLPTLRAFPPEIRSAIFKHSMDIDGPLPTQMPALITALRPDQTLYHEALEVLHKDSCFSFDIPQRTVSTISESRTEYIRKLVLR